MSRPGLGPAGFEMREVVGRHELARHPVWATWGDPDDRELVLGWGVDPDLLERALSRFDDCGPSLLFPVLGSGPLPDKAGLLIAARFETAAGHELSGYVLLPHAFGLYAGDRELSFNRTLPRLASRNARTLAEHLGADTDALFPLGFETSQLRPDGTPLRGEITRFW